MGHIVVAVLVDYFAFVYLGVDERPADGLRGAVQDDGETRSVRRANRQRGMAG